MRNFIIQAMPEESPSVPLGKQFEENWETANALILHESSSVEVAAALCNELSIQGAQAKILSFAEAQAQALTDSIDFTHFIAVLPCVPSDELSPDAELLSIIKRLRSVATPPPASRSAREHTTVAYVQFGGGLGTQPQIAHMQQCCAISFAASLHLERTDLKVRVIDFSPTVNPIKLAERAIAELSTRHLYTVVGYDAHLTRRVPRPKVQEPVEYCSRAITWSSDDVILVTGYNLSALRIEDVCLEHPIVVDPIRGVEIEIHAEVLERKFKSSEQQVYVVIRTEQTNFATSHFSATFVLGVESNSLFEHVELPSVPLDIQPQADLYSWLLFQGPRFQRLQQVYSLNSHKCVFQIQRSLSSSDQKEFSNRVEGPFLLGDPYCRDSLLQAGQLIIPPDICLPIRINSIEIYQSNSNVADSYIGVTEYQGQVDKKYYSTVFAVDANGHVLERLNSYQLQILEHREENHTAEILAEPGFCQRLRAS